jgi:hypothetical protein
MIDELENRVRELAAEVEGEKAVPRQVYQQAVRNGDALRAVQIVVAEMASRVDHVVQEVIQNTAAVRTHGARLDTLSRDVGLLRSDRWCCAVIWRSCVRMWTRGSMPSSGGWTNGLTLS